MRLCKQLPLCLLLLIADHTRPTGADLVPRAVQRAQRSAIKYAHGFLKDLRLAFRGGNLVVRTEPSSSGSSHEGQCELKQAPFILSPPNTTCDCPTSSGSLTTAKSSSSASGTKSAASSEPTATNPGPDSPQWTPQVSYFGNNFFQGWEFYTFPDQTGGIVTYVDEDTARLSGLLEVNSQGNAVMRVETTPVVATMRKSIRITTQFTFNGGLVILDAVHVPTGCGTWPAFWTNGPNWPATGEIDILEGANDYTNDQATIHTTPGCTLPSTDSNTLSITGTVLEQTDCASVDTQNEGCSIRASQTNSFGAAFNANGGGTYAMKWDTTGIAVYFFPRGSEPSDISAQNPQPDSWGPAMARWPASSCDPFQFFQNHSVIFDTTLCGDLAGAIWSVAGPPGQEQSCAQRTGVSTCESFVTSTGSAFDEAYWEIQRVDIYQLQN